MSQLPAESETLIAEDLLLLLMDDEKGRLAAASASRPLFGGALLIELALDEAVEVEEKRGLLHTPKVHARQPRVRERPDPLLARAWHTVAEKPRSAQDLVNRLGKGVREELQARLVTRGILERRETKVLGLFPSTTWPAADMRHERQLRQELQGCLVTGLTPRPRTAALVALLSSVDQAHKVVDRGPLSNSEVRKRAKAIAEGAWAAKAVREAVAASQAAVTTAVMVATSSATAST
ncbi:GOLPH3/VPS74 family protein [Nocardioides jishulii]|uniref:GPP34 family phosphoprotein n=1 Tax=Nocardioides jishulii TaxID=2575440 RepID=A0A4V5TJY7_9ACTN|nr:GPP34 family phosphoprotein [Nocardioides jishulii]QCX26910.1 GPP34 family phosphoprotein [Nocardioides jishulii]TKI61393.1 GPP34 family phosphoprotein [Nocardioides jishulii]